MTDPERAQLEADLADLLEQRANVLDTPPVNETAALRRATWLTLNLAEITRCERVLAEELAGV